MLHMKKVSEYGQEILQSHTADKPMAPRGRDTEHKQSQYIRKTTEVEQRSTICLFFSIMIPILERALSTA